MRAEYKPDFTRNAKAGLFIAILVKILNSNIDGISHREPNCQCFDTFVEVAEESVSAAIFLPSPTCCNTAMHWQGLLITN